MCKPTLHLLFILLMFPCGLLAQTNAEKINDIKKICAEINKEKGLKTVSLSDEQFVDHACDNGCTLTASFRKDTIKKMWDWIGLSYGIIERTFYFKHRRLVFVNETERHFVRDSTGAPLYNKTPMIVFEGRFYFENGKLIGSSIKGEKFGHEKETPVKLLALANTYFALLNDKKDGNIK